jgi:hypothetical protein
MKIKAIASLLGGSTLAAVLGTPVTSDAAIHEMVAAYCSGGGVGAIEANGFLEPPGVTDPTKKNFARPPTASGAVVVVNPDPLLVEIGTSPNAKYPAGTVVVDLATFTFLQVSQADHPSTHCKNFSTLP